VSLRSILGEPKGAIDGAGPTPWKGVEAGNTVLYRLYRTMEQPNHSLVARGPLERSTDNRSAENKSAGKIQADNKPADQKSDSKNLTINKPTTN
jgi:hypothetical protein